MTFTRRKFLAAGALTIAGLNSRTARAFAAPWRMGVSTYSFWHFKGAPTPIEKCLELASEMGFDGVEILHVHMEEAAKAAGGCAHVAASLPSNGEAQDAERNPASVGADALGHLRR